LQEIGPTHGIVNFNFAKIKKFKYNENIIFEDVVEIVIHEMMHILGFSAPRYIDWINKETGNKYE
jgi:leishmanolysin